VGACCRALRVPRRPRFARPGVQASARTWRAPPATQAPAGLRGRCRTIARLDTVRAVAASYAVLQGEPIPPSLAPRRHCRGVVKRHPIVDLLPMCPEFSGRIAYPENPTENSASDWPISAIYSMLF